jgi:hypothetical protein
MNPERNPGLKLMHSCLVDAVKKFRLFLSDAHPKDAVA